MWLLVSGHYMFVEASGKNDGKKAIMISPKYRGLKSQCFSFYYHMYGEHCGTLNVYTTVSRIYVSSRFLFVIRYINMVTTFVIYEWYSYYLFSNI